MIWIERFLFWVGTAGLTGSIAVCILLLLDHLERYRGNRYFIGWIKAAQILFLCPFILGALMLSRVFYIGEGVFGYIGGFGMETTPVISHAFRIVGAGWLMGLFGGMIVRLVQRLRLHRLLGGNVPVEREDWKKIIREYQEKYRLTVCEVYQNDILYSPITMGIIRPKIILPFASYTNGQLRMVMEHEINHIRGHDLLWRRIGLLITLVHWWNPLAYMLLDLLTIYQEMECDVRTCQNGADFTARDYALFLIGMEKTENSKVFYATLGETKRNLKRRLEMMAKKERMKNRRRWKTVVSCLVLSLLALTPAYAASETAAKAQEQWVYATEEGMRLGAEADAMQNAWASEEEGVTEILLTPEISPLSVNEEIVLEIAPNTRYLLGFVELENGDAVAIDVFCTDKTARLRVGIKDKEGKMMYTEGEWGIFKTFEIERDGEYSPFVQNMSNKTIEVTVEVHYSYN